MSITYRIKTEKDFLKDYGHNWLMCVPWNREGRMDYLFGLILTKEQYEEALDRWTLVPTLDGEGHWYIYGKLVTSVSNRFEKHKEALLAV